MTHPADTDNLDNSQLLQINHICNDFERAWQTGEPSLAEYVDRAQPPLRNVLLRNLIELDVEYRQQRQLPVSSDMYQTQFAAVDANWLNSVMGTTAQPQSVSVEIDDSGINLSVEELLKRVRASQIVAEDMTVTLGSFDLSTATADEVGTALVNAEHLTDFQLESLVHRPVEQLVLGDYVLLEKIGEGGMGAVYRAMHRRMKRIVAVKMLKQPEDDAQEMSRRFEREIQVAARLSHPHIVAAYDAGEEHGQQFLVSEYIDGQNLSEIVRELGPLSLPDAIDVVRQMVDGLVYAHGQGVIHRDIKPSNLLLDDDGNAKLLDVGLARLSDPTDKQQSTDLTRTGLIMGTVDFMSPEQAQNTRLADERSDIYSVGCSLHFLITGRPPYFGTTSIERLLAHRDLPIPDLLELNDCVPSQLQDVLEGCMAKSPDNRYQTAAELHEALTSLGDAGLPEITLPVVDAEEFQRAQTQQWTTPAEETRRWSPSAAADQSQTAATIRDTTAAATDSPTRPSPLVRFSLGGTAAVLLLAGLWMGWNAWQTDPATSPGPRPALRELSELTEQEAREYRAAWQKVVSTPDLGTLDLSLSLLPPGTFTLPSGELALNEPLLISTTEVPVGAYRQFVAATGHRSDANEGGYGFDAVSGRWIFGPDFGWNNLGDIPVSDDMPTVCVNYNDATAFCRWASETTGLTIRLPTETEWEYASRCGKPGDWCCGESADQLDDFAWHVGNSQSRLYKVGTRTANAWGISDMHGNESEWCLPSDGDPEDSAPLRGGSHSSTPEECTHTARQLQRKRQVVHGAFRVVVEVRQP